MKQLKIAFLLSSIRDFKFEDDTSFSIMSECQRRNHTLYVIESRDLVLSQNVLYGRITPCRTCPKQGLVLMKPLFMDLRNLDCLFLRKEPPFNTDYLACTHLVDFLRKDVFLINDPAGIRSANEKISALHFPYFTPKSVLGMDPDLLCMMMRRHTNGPVVLKRIDEKGGKGILKTHMGSKGLKRGVRLLVRETQAPIIIQRYVPHQTRGDKRILILDGRPLGAFSRIPGPDDFRANMALGGKAVRAVISRKDIAIIRGIRRFLLSQGLYFTGIDLLGDRLTEINVTSPAGIPEINRFDGVHLERRVLKFIESKC